MEAAEDGGGDEDRTVEVRECARARAQRPRYGVTCRLSLRETAERSPGCVRLVCERSEERGIFRQPCVWCRVRKKSCSA